MVDDVTFQTTALATPPSGTVVAMNTGVRDAGTQRVTIATNDIVPASQSGTWNIGTVTTVTGVTTVSTVTSLSQFAGQAIALNTGTRSAGTLRVTIATDDIVPASQSGTWNIGTVTTVTGVTTVSTVTSLSQFNGVAIALNTGTRSAGTLRVTIATDDIVPASQSGTWNIGTVTTVTGVTTVTSLTQFNGVAIALNTGTRSAGTLRVTVATDDVVPASQSGTWNIGTVTTVTTVSTLSAISAGSNLIADVGIQPRTTNGFTTFMASGSDGSSILVATKQTIKNSAGKIYGWYLYNPEAAVTFVHIYNTDTVTVGTTNPLLTLAIPPGSAANVMSEIGVTFDTAMSTAATTTAGGTGAPATGVSAVFFYK